MREFKKKSLKNNSPNQTILDYTLLHKSMIRMEEYVNNNTYSNIFIYFPLKYKNKDNLKPLYLLIIFCKKISCTTHS